MLFFGHLALRPSILFPRTNKLCAGSFMIYFNDTYMARDSIASCSIPAEIFKRA